MQYIIVKSDLKSIDFKQLITDSIENIDEILPADFIVQKGLRGFVQLIILKLLAEKMKDSYDKRYFD